MTLNNDKNLEPIKDLSKRNSDSSNNISGKKDMKDKIFRLQYSNSLRNSRSLHNQNNKGCELKDESNKFVGGSFRGATSG